MKGTRVVVTSPLTVEYETFAIDPADVGNGRVLVSLHSTLISSGTELAIYQGRDPRVFQPGEWCQYPFRPGVIGIGEALVVGKGIEHVKPGDMVFCHAHHASIDIVDAEHFLCLPLPPSVSTSDAILARHVTIALTALRLSKPELGDRVVVYGLGLIGNLAVQLFKIAGARVLGVDPVEERRDLLHRQAGVECLAAGLLSLEGIERNLGGRPDIAVDAVGSSSVVLDAIQLVKPRGQVVLLGTPHDPYNLDITPFLRAIHFNWITIRGALEWYFPIYEESQSKHSYESHAREALELLGLGSLQTRGLISHTLKPKHFKDAYDGLLHKKSEYMAALIDWS